MARNAPVGAGIIDRRPTGHAAAAPAGVETFDSTAYQAINRGRMEHLASLGLDLDGRSVLDVGCGVGDLAQFFVQRGCRVTCVDGRADNIAALRWRYPTLDAHVADAQCDALSKLGRFDIVFCYGLLYHLENPVAGLRNLASACGDLLVLETVVCDALRPVVEFVDEHASHDQALAGLGCRPAPAFVALALHRAGFVQVYAPVRPPDHADFQFERRGDGAWFRDGHFLRSVFVAARRELSNPNLTPLVS